MTSNCQPTRLRKRHKVKEGMRYLSFGGLEEPRWRLIRRSLCPALPVSLPRVALVRNNNNCGVQAAHSFRVVRTKREGEEERDRKRGKRERERKREKTGTGGDSCE